MVPTPRKVSAPENPEPEKNSSIDEVLQAPEVTKTAAENGDELQKKKHLTRDERLAKHTIQCQHLINYITTNTCPPDLTKKEIRNVKNQARTHQWDPRSKMFTAKLYYLCFI